MKKKELQILHNEITKEIEAVCSRFQYELRAGLRGAVSHFDITTAGGLHCMFDVHHKERTFVVILHWYTELESTSKLSEKLSWTVNPFHYQKATEMTNSLAGLYQLLGLRLAQVKSGEAFQRIAE